jgi:hypothetical protein
LATDSAAGIIVDDDDIQIPLVEITMVSDDGCRATAHSIGKGGGTMQIVIEVVDILEIVPT